MNLIIKNAISNIRINTILSILIITIGMMLVPNRAVALPGYPNYYSATARLTPAPECCLEITVSHTLGYNINY